MSLNEENPTSTTNKVKQGVMHTMSSSEENPILTTVSEEEEKLPITVLPPKQQRFVQLYMTGQYSIPKLADLLQVHPNTLHNWLKRKDVRAIVEDMQQSTHDIVGMQLKALTMTAVHKLGELTKSPIDGVALQAVKDILDRAGHKPKQEIKVDKTVRTFEEKLSEVMAKTIDVEYEVEE